MVHKAMPSHPEDRIVRDRQICGGEPVFKGTRVTLRSVLATLAAGDNPDDILADLSQALTQAEAGNSNNRQAA